MEFAKRSKIKGYLFNQKNLFKFVEKNIWKILIKNINNYSQI
jgi:hypothetical protein